MPPSCNSSHRERVATIMQIAALSRLSHAVLQRNGRLKRAIPEFAYGELS